MRQRSMLAAAGLALLAAAWSFFPGCGGDKDEPEANCADSMKHFLFEGCSLVSDYGIEEGLTAATAWCMAEEALSNECGCSMYFPVVLECFLAASVSNCDACDSVMVDLQNCEWQSDCPGIRSCSRMLGHFYDQNCTMTNNGTPLSEMDAVAWCEGAQEQAATCNCSTQLDAVLLCLGQSGYEQCSSCGPQFEAYNTCFSACP